ncbi:short-chain dehydrogenase [Massilia eurypsychrophila]|uniref:Short-chain dehydrogenase n=1 Tax=Massilia eurypsychrophila TaxID=1485217 RepID=A0A2G8TIB8_9BURK|nr:SDR family oxidoreductase [Massilia eurypsychrophila]PIL45791.1 short-chain dehydrogenase [Massilia eurypsychrophila]
MTTTKRCAVVTGGSAGIGAEICQQLLAGGYEVVSLSRRAPAFTHERLHSVEVDLADRAATALAAREVAERFAPDTLVHNAGVILPARLEEVKLEDLDTLVEIHLGAAIQLAQAMLPAMKAGGFGRIVLLSSRGALGLAGRTNYGATKSGMFGMARTWALELAPHGVTVNVVAPGPVQTDMFHEIVPVGSPKVAALAASIPVKRLGQPNDVAHAVKFFTSAEAGFVTGQVLYVCGGTSLGGLVL